jgi:hypothetical protein
LKTREPVVGRGVEANTFQVKEQREGVSKAGNLTRDVCKVLHDVEAG